MAKSVFLAAAEHCDKLARAITEKQYAATGIDAVPVEEPGPLHPEEAWARRFATHMIRQEREPGARPPFTSFVPPPANMPRMPRFATVNTTDEPARTAVNADTAGHIGSSLGKPGPKRGIFGRLFRGRGI